MTYLEDVITTANVGGHAGVEHKWIVCADGFSVSVIAGGGTYCTPRPALCGAVAPGLCPSPPLPHQVECTYTGPFSHVEVGFPSERPEPWGEWLDYADWADDDYEPTMTIYSYVPVDLVRDLVAAHGGEPG